MQLSKAELFWIKVKYLLALKIGVNPNAGN